MKFDTTIVRNRKNLVRCADDLLFFCVMEFRFMAMIPMNKLYCLDGAVHFYNCAWPYRAVAVIIATS